MIPTAPCYNKKLGHNVVGSVCIQCGISKDDLARTFVARMEKMPLPAKIPAKTAKATIHSEAHALALDLSNACGEPKKYALYLGIVSRVGLVRGYVMLSKLKDPRSGIKHPARWLMWQASSKNNATIQPSGNSLGRQGVATGNAYGVVARGGKGLKGKR